MFQALLDVLSDVWSSPVTVVLICLCTFLWAKANVTETSAAAPTAGDGSTGTEGAAKLWLERLSASNGQVSGHWVTSLPLEEGDSSNSNRNRNTTGEGGSRQFWRLLTAPLLHVSALHLLFSVGAMWSFRFLEGAPSAVPAAATTADTDSATNGGDAVSEYEDSPVPLLRVGSWFLLRYTLLLLPLCSAGALLLMRLLVGRLAAGSGGAFPAEVLSALREQRVFGLSGLVLAWASFTAVRDYANVEAAAVVRRSAGLDGPPEAASYMLLGVFPLPFLAVPFFLLLLANVMVPRDAGLGSAGAVAGTGSGSRALAAVVPASASILLLNTSGLLCGLLLGAGWLEVLPSAYWTACAACNGVLCLLWGRYADLVTVGSWAAGRRAAGDEDEGGGVGDSGALSDVETGDGAGAVRLRRRRSADNVADEGESGDEGELQEDDGRSGPNRSLLPPPSASWLLYPDYHSMATTSGQVQGLRRHSPSAGGSSSGGRDRNFAAERRRRAAQAVGSVRFTLVDATSGEVCSMFLPPLPQQVGGGLGGGISSSTITGGSSVEMVGFGSSSISNGAASSHITGSSNSSSSSAGGGGSLMTEAAEDEDGEGDEEAPLMMRGASGPGGGGGRSTDSAVSTGKSAGVDWLGGFFGHSSASAPSEGAETAAGSSRSVVEEDEDDERAGLLN